LKKWEKNWTKLFQRSPKGQKTHEEILNILHHKGNANENHIKISFLLECQSSRTEQQILARMWIKRNPYILLVGL
jgi:hypothetical protein